MTRKKEKSKNKNGKLSFWLVRQVLVIILGGLFFYAGFQKYIHPYEFAEAVLAYQLAPPWSAGAVAAVLPWMELISGAFLAVGLKRRSCLLLIMLLCAAFLAVMAVTMARGLKIDCGCGLFFQRQVGLVAALEDLALLAWAGGLYWWETKAVAVSSKQ